MTWSLSATGHVDADLKEDLINGLRTTLAGAGTSQASLTWSLGEDQETIDLLADSEGEFPEVEEDEAPKTKHEGGNY